MLINIKLYGINNYNRENLVIYYSKIKWIMHQFFTLWYLDAVS